VGYLGNWKPETQDSCLKGSRELETQVPGVGDWGLAYYGDVLGLVHLTVVQPQRPSKGDSVC
jgi:hypothetical protein